MGDPAPPPPPVIPPPPEPTEVARVAPAAGTGNAPVDSGQAEAPPPKSTGTKSSPAPRGERNRVGREDALPAIPPPPKIGEPTQTEAAPRQIARVNGQTNGTSVGSAAAGVGGDQTRLAFASGANELDDAARGKLDGVAHGLVQNPKLRLQLLAYAGGTSDAGSQARRLSLSRALSVRSYLIEKGVPSTRIDVRALGNKIEEGPPDRVDVVVTQR